ncbi:hypothetical protein KWH04_00970 [Xanthomonas campestris pv. trichodesmae]|uniref:Uncharacterized protein n=2 Tax=Xanthomonas citri TaxID=346 RepID=A0AB33CJZ6_XANCI|nr:hypothetical protein [Xanthomonas citri]ASK91087.1 hypothetical protein XcvCFBP7111P_05840 [Xanthomonas citri pv. vignicola]MBV6779241.1 hypothetical protein [Xanthomonas campestris pv. trichodesmae]MBZ3921755.1 hypothetical protein [Xanthomonas campestris pv. trichodesmae]MBZ3926355.1 hypothetical protein [Xanthomonas citri pv. sesbaniae]
MDLNQRFDDEEYKRHQIRVYARRVDAYSYWLIEVDVQRPDGGHYPMLSDDDHSWATLEQAFSYGRQMGRELVDQNEH